MKNRAIILVFICGIIFTGCSTREITAKRYDVKTQNTRSPYAMTSKERARKYAKISKAVPAL